MADHGHLDHNVSTGPAWGALALDVFMIEYWTPRSDTDMSNDEQRLALVRKYLEIGSLGRRKYVEAAGTTEPTEAQIDTILRPLRSLALRSIAQQLLRGPGWGGATWLRTDYKKEGRHEQFCLEGINGDASGEGLLEDSQILSDERYYNVDSWQKVLDFLPELAIHYSERWHDVTESSYRLGCLRREDERCYDEEGGEYMLCSQQHCCVARFVIVEDTEMYAFDPPRFHGLWLDDCGNIVRENRITAEDAAGYPTMNSDAMGSEQEIWIEASIGPKYIHGAEYGPPFTERSVSSLGQDLQPLHI